MEKHGEVRPDRAGRIEEAVRATLPEGLDAECAIVAVMCAMTGRMSRAEAERIADALPERHRRFLADCVHQREEQQPASGRAEVVHDVATALRIEPALAEGVARAVLRVVASELPQGLLRRALAQLPRGVASLWASPVEGPGAGPVPIRPTLVTFEVGRDTVVEHPVTQALERMHAVPDGFTGASTFSLVVRTLTRRLPRGEAVRIVESLPAALRPLVEPDLANREQLPEVFGRAELLDRLADGFAIDRPSAELVARAVFGSLQQLLDADEIRHVESQLPEDMAELWRLGQTRLTEVGVPTKIRRVLQPARGPRKRREELSR